MKSKLIKRLIAGVFAAVALTGVVVFAANYGTSNDPLVTLSYLTDVFKSSVMTEVDSKISTAESDLTKKFNDKLSSAGMGGTSDFEVVSLTSGQKIVGEVGTEILLRLGTATCNASSTPGLVDTTSGSTINNGASLAANHMYLVSIDGNGIKASGSATLLVAGSYTVE